MAHRSCANLHHFVVVVIVMAATVILLLLLLTLDDDDSDDTIVDVYGRNISSLERLCDRRVTISWRPTR